MQSLVVANYHYVKTQVPAVCVVSALSGVFYLFPTPTHFVRILHVMSYRFCLLPNANFCQLFGLCCNTVYYYKCILSQVGSIPNEKNKKHRKHIPCATCNMGVWEGLNQTPLLCQLSPETLSQQALTESLVHTRKQLTLNVSFALWKTILICRKQDEFSLP